MRTLLVTFTYSFNGVEDEKSFDIEGGQTANDIKEMIAESLIEDYEPEEDEEEEFEPTASDIELISCDCDEDVSEEYMKIENIFTFADAYCECDQECNVVEAAMECGIDGSDIDEAYSGSFDDDEDFARDMAEQLGAIDKNATWPQTCIDWEFAAKELMYDYSEHNGYYFRNM